MAVLFDPHFQAGDANGLPRVGALLYFYVAGSTTMFTVYQDSGATTPRTNPVVADSAGLFPPIFIDRLAPYKYVLKDADGITIQTADGIHPVPDSGELSNAVEDAQAAASSTQAELDSRAYAVSSYHPASPPNKIRTAGYAAAGDNGGALYKKGASEPSHAGKLSITLADGVTVVWYEIAEKQLVPQMFGAAANGATGGSGTDDAANIQSTIDAALALGAKVVASGSYRIDSKIVIKGPFDGSMATFYATGTATTGIAVEVSTGSSANPTDILTLTTEGEMILPSVFNTAKTGTGWVGFGVGVRYVNVQNMKITERLVEGFSVGFLHTSYVQGCGYNTVQGGYLRTNKVNRQFSVNSGGFTNRWDFFGGRYFMASAEGTNVAGTRHVLVDTGTGNIINDINFFGASLEGNAPEYIIDIGGNYCQFIATRWEASGGIKVKWSNAGNSGEGCDNVIAWNRGSDSIVETTASGAIRNKIWASRNTSKLSASGPVFKLGNRSASTDPVIMAYDATIDPNNATAGQESGKFGAARIGGKATADIEDRVFMDLANGRLYAGPGGAVAAVGFLDASGATINRWRGTHFQIQQAATWNSGNLFMMGSNYLWVDGSGRLRIKATTAPTSDTDGAVVGTQT